MKLGMMNDPALDVIDETRWAAGHGFDFIDLTIEGPAAAVDQIDVTALKTVLEDTGLGIVGHTAWYLPFGSPVPQVRAGAVEAVRATFETFATLGARSISVHVDKGINAFTYDDTLRWNAESFLNLAEQAQDVGLTIAVENVFNNCNTA